MALRLETPGAEHRERYEEMMEEWEGYGGRPPQSRQGDIRLAVYTLLNRLWNAYVYQKEYNQPENAQRERADALRQAALLRGWLQP